MARSPLQPKRSSDKSDARENELASTVRKVMRQYFKDLDGEKPSGIYDMVVAAVEKPMLEVVMFQAQGNQTRAAEMLGVNRNTLRKKLQQHGID
jgi:Fis family transcriptional regulator